MATQRGYYREEMERATNNIEMALTHLTRVMDAYRDAHPDISEAIKQCCDAIVMVGETVLSIHDSV